MDPSPPTVAKDITIQRAYTCFRTLGYRHMVVVDGELVVVGMITRSDMNEHSLKHYWEEAGEQMQNDMRVDNLPPAIVYEIRPAKPSGGLGELGGLGGLGAGGARSRSGSMQSDRSHQTDDADADPEIHEAYQDVSDSPKVTLRKSLAPPEV